MKKKISLALVLVLIFSLAFSSCSRDSGIDKDMTYPIDFDPSCLDPQIAAGNSAIIVINNCFEGLVRIDEQGKITPGVAKSWSVSDNGLTYTFDLRPDASWHLIKSFADVLGEDYKESFDTRVTANDFVYAFQRALSPETNSGSAASLYLIKNAQKVHEGSLAADKLGVKANGDYTLIITLINKNADFLYTLTKAACMPCNKEFFDATKGKYGLNVEYLLCNGPFYLSQWSQDISLTLRRNVDYVGDWEVYPSSVSLTVDDGESSRLEKLLEGTYSAAPVSQLSATELKSNEDITLTEYENITWLFSFNCRSSELSNMYIRLAICNAIDRASVEIPSNAYAARGFIPECCKVGGENFRGLSGEADFVDYSAAKAKEYLSKGLEETGYSSVDITLLCTSEHETIMRKLLQKWQQIFGLGINITIEVLEKTELMNRVESGDYQLAFMPVSASDSSAASFLQDYASSSSGDIFNYSSKTYDSIVKKLSGIGDVSQTAAGCLQAESHLLQNGVIYPLYSQSSFFALAKNVSGIYTHPAGENVCFIKALRTD